MGQSLVKIYTHIVFSTKNRVKFIQPSIEPSLHEYIGGICNGLNCSPIKIGGYTDHIHILTKLSSRIAVMNLIERVKSQSSKWIKTKDGNYDNFYWQRGYGAFSISPSHVDSVIEYIGNQHEHHKELTFKAEYRLLLDKYNVDYDERYVWD